MSGVILKGVLCKWKQKNHHLKAKVINRNADISHFKEIHMTPQSPEEKFSATIDKLKDKYLPKASKVAMNFGLILIASLIASWGFEWVMPVSVPDGIDHKAYSHLQILAGFILVTIALTLSYAVLIFSKIFKFKREGMRALSLMAKEMEKNLHRND
jgi:hypothetical protein